MNPAGRPVSNAPLPSYEVAVTTPAFTLPRVTFGAPAIVVAEPVTLPTVQTNDVAVIIPAPASIPVELVVTIPATTEDAEVDTPETANVPVVVTPVTTAPSGNSGDVPAVLPLKLVTLSVAIRDLRFEGHQ